MQYLRRWRDSRGLSRQQVADKLTALLDASSPLDQATIAKWESGETAVRVEDIKLLAEIYNTKPDRLFYDPVDERTPALMQRAFDILAQLDADNVDAWLAIGERLKRS